MTSNDSDSLNVDDTRSSDHTVVADAMKEHERIIELPGGGVLTGTSYPIDEGDLIPSLEGVSDPLSVLAPDGPSRPRDELETGAYKSASGFSFPREDLGREFYERVVARPVEQLGAISLASPLISPDPSGSPEDLQV